MLVLDTCICRIAVSVLSVIINCSVHAINFLQRIMHFPCIIQLHTAASHHMYLAIKIAYFTMASHSLFAFRSQAFLIPSVSDLRSLVSDL
jgi:hypothetical protein